MWYKDFVSGPAGARGIWHRAGGYGVKAWRIGLAASATGLVLAALALGGCTPTPPAPPPPAPAVSYDGTYQGTVTLLNVGAGVPRIGCQTAPQIALTVKNNSFTYVQTHPQATISAPGFPTTNATATYAVTVAPNGSFSGQSQLSGTMSGAITGTHMAGKIEGLECVYSFTADRG
jgi:hypothetical protein